MAFQDGAGLLLEIGELDVVLGQGLGFRADGIAPIGDGLQHIQKDRAAGPEGGDLLFQVYAAAVRVSRNAWYCS